MNSSSLFTQVKDASRLLTGGAKQPGNEKAIHRIQGFVAGATFVFLIQLIGNFVFTKSEEVLLARTISWGVAFLAALIYTTIIVSIDKNEKEPWVMIFISFFWGTVISGTIAGLLNSIAYQKMGITFSVAPFTEEISKGAVLLLIFLYASNEFDNVLDGIIYGALVGIGFAMQENVDYFMKGFENLPKFYGQIEKQFFLRIILGGLASHATYTAITGIGLGISRQIKKRWMKVVFPILGLTLAISAHALWNSEWVNKWLELERFGSPHLRISVRAFWLMGPFFLLVIIAIVLAWRKESMVIFEQLSNEITSPNPFLTLETLRKVSARRKARWRILSNHGLSAMVLLQKIQRAYIDLAFSKMNGFDEQAMHTRQQIEFQVVNLEKVIQSKAKNLLNRGL